MGSADAGSPTAHDAQALSLEVANTKTIQLRDVPVKLHRELTRRAKARGMTLNDYIQEVLEREASKPTHGEVVARMRRR